MRTTVLSFILLSIVFTSSAQDSLKNEIGFTLKGFNSFGLSVKFESQENRLWRLGALSFFGNSDKTTSDSVAIVNQRFGMEFGFGREIRKPIVKDFYIFFGVDAIVGFSVLKDEISVDGDNLQAFDRVDNKSAYAGIGIPVGFGYNLKEVVNFNIEFEPSFGYRYRNIAAQNSNMNKPKEAITHSFFSSINTESLRLSVAYRFGKRR